MIYINGMIIKMAINEEDGENMSNSKHIKVTLGPNVIDRNYKEKRACFADLQYFLYDTEHFWGRICALYGLRRSGKTVMMEQSILDMPLEKQKESAYLLFDGETDMVELEDCLDDLIDQGIKYIFIDEITYLPDFQGLSNVLSDIYGMRAKIVIAGTDSLGIRLAMKDRLFDRVFSIHTTHVSYADYTRLLGGKSLDEYIEYGGTLTNDFYKDNQSRKEYQNIYIAENILHSLDSGYGGRRYWSSLTKIYERGELVSIINKMINQFSYTIVLEAIQRDYKSAPLYATRRNLRPVPYRNMLDFSTVNESVKKSLGILNRDEMKTEIREEDLRDLKNYLQDLDLFLIIPMEKSLRKAPYRQDMEIFLQPGMVYSHATELIRELAEDEVWTKTCGIEDRQMFIDRANGFVKGEIMENIVLSETFLDLGGSNDFRDRYYVSQLSLGKGINGYAGEFAEADMIVMDRTKQETYLFEVKHSQEMVENQTRHLMNGDFIAYVGDHFAPVKRRAIIYSGPSVRGYDVDYINAEEYLKEIDAMRVEKTADLEERLENVLRKADAEKERRRNISLQTGTPSGPRM